MEVIMKTFAVFALAGLVLSSPALAKNVCVRSNEIVSTHSDDGKVLVFKMRNGQTWINHLKGACPDLKFEGFEWTLRGIDDICENQQSLRVLRSGQICVLGKFDAPIEKPAPR
jgi:hypothetical protein